MSRMCRQLRRLWKTLLDDIVTGMTTVPYQNAAIYTPATMKDQISFQMQSCSFMIPSQPNPSQPPSRLSPHHCGGHQV